MILVTLVMTTFWISHINSIKECQQYWLKLSEQRDQKMKKLINVIEFLIVLCIILIFLRLSVIIAHGQEQYTVVLPLITRENVINSTPSTVERELFNLVNIFRQENNCEPLTWVDGLAYHAAIGTETLNRMNSLHPDDIWWIYGEMLRDGYQWNVASIVMAGGEGVPQPTDVDILWRNDLVSRSILWDCQYIVGGIGYTKDPNSKWMNTWALVMLSPYDPMLQ